MLQKINRSIGNIINLLYPPVLGAVFLATTIHLNLSYSLKGFSNVMESIITFASIIIGFYTAMYGILLTTSNTSFMNEFRRHHVEGIFQFQLYDSLIVSFTILMMSIVLQILIHYPGRGATWIFNIWSFIFGYFIATSYRAIALLLKLLFLRKPNLPNKPNIDVDKKMQQIQRINKKRL